MANSRAENLGRGWSLNTEGLACVKETPVRRRLSDRRVFVDFHSKSDWHSTRGVEGAPWRRYVVEHGYVGHDENLRSMQYIDVLDTSIMFITIIIGRGHRLGMLETIILATNTLL